MGVIDRLVPPRLGRDFRWLWPSFAASNLADGILIASGPLLVTTVTRSPMAVAAALFAQQVPWLILSVVAGAVIDRVDRRKLIITVDALRALAIALLAIAIAADALSLALIYAVMFLIGIAETFADNAGHTIIAVTVPPAALGAANARLMGTRVVTNQLGGPPIGALLFGVGAALPFGANAVLLLLGAVFASRIHLPGGDGARRDGAERNLRREITEGMRWLWAHRPVRTLALLITAFNITYGAASSIWVL